MGLQITQFLKALLLPPGIFILLLGAGIVLLRKQHRHAKSLIYASFIFMLLSSLPVVSMTLLSFVESHPALTNSDLANSNAQAIVILGGGSDKHAPEYDGDTVNKLTLQRLRYGARLHRLTMLPVLVTGGSMKPEYTPEAELMAKSLQEDFNVKAQWQETRSRNTAENAMYSAEILKMEGITNIILVTHAEHMPRSVDIFERQGLKVLAAPTAFMGFYEKSTIELNQFTPDARALRETYFALHEILGRIWYFVRY